MAVSLKGCGAPAAKARQAQARTHSGPSDVQEPRLGRSSPSVETGRGRRWRGRRRHSSRTSTARPQINTDTVDLLSGRSEVIPELPRGVKIFFFFLIIH